MEKKALSVLVSTDYRVPEFDENIRRLLKSFQKLSLVIKRRKI